MESRFARMLEACSKKISQPVPSSHQNTAMIKGTYRFWDNPSVTPQAMMNYQLEKIGQDMGLEGSSKRILQLCDYTELDYTGSRAADLLGPLTYRHQRGIHLYNSMFINSLGCPLGLFKQSFHTRSDEKFGTSRKESRNLSLEQKERVHWVKHFNRGQEFIKVHQGHELVFIADREGDFMELFAQRSEPNMHFLVRSHYDRHLSNKAGKLVPTVNSWVVQGTYQAKVIHSKTRKMRMAQLEVRFGQLEIELADPTPQKKNLLPVPLFVVDVREVGADVDKEEQIHWRLLTTLPVQCFEDAKLMIQYYIWRWLIERFHFLLKSGGAKVENLQLETPHRLINAITTFSIAAMDAFKIRYLAQNTPDESIYNVGISELEHQVLYTYLSKKLRIPVHFDPQKPPSIREYCIYLGKIGGFLPSKRQPIPGLIILTRAREKLDTLIDAYLTFQ